MFTLRFILSLVLPVRLSFGGGGGGQQQKPPKMRYPRQQKIKIPEMPAVDPPPPPVEESSEEVAQAEDNERKKQKRKKGLSKTLLAGETGGTGANLGGNKSLLGQGK